jgi:hypothetical protein
VPTKFTPAFVPPLPPVCQKCPAPNPLSVAAITPVKPLPLPLKLLPLLLNVTAFSYVPVRFAPGTMPLNCPAGSVLLKLRAVLANIAYGAGATAGNGFRLT